jgi:hypothetical protein
MSSISPPVLTLNRTKIFTQPSGTIKCAGAPQKIMWMVRRQNWALKIGRAGLPQLTSQAVSQWKHSGARSAIKPTFATGTPSKSGRRAAFILCRSMLTSFYITAMFGVAKYSAALDKLRKERDIEGLFQHDLSAVDASKRVATFKTADGSSVTREFDLLHVVPPQGPLDFVRNSPLGLCDFPFRHCITP